MTTIEPYRPTRLLLLVALVACLPRDCDAAVDARPAASAPASVARERPLMRDFMGLNVHTVQFKPDLYAPVCRRVRDYHPIGWDVGADPVNATTFPFAANRVDWGTMYGSWNKAGFDIDACLMFDDFAPDKWKDPAASAHAYGLAFAKAFGPSSATPRVSAVEVGNEPSKYSAAQYRAILEGMAAGLREGDKKLTIATCAVMTGSPDAWSKPTSAIAGLEPLYDALNIHSYPFKEKWPTWRRSFPEDPSIPFLKSVVDLARWRDDHARGKALWLTEFGYDSATKPPAPRGDWKQWVGVTDEEQARYIVRAFLTLSAMDLDRAYLYFFNDKDEPQLHGASGITRDFKPKPSFHAMAHLYKTLGDYRFARAVSREANGLYCFDYVHASRPADHVYVAWIADGEGRRVRRTIDIGSGKVERAQRMPMTAGEAQAVEWKPAPGGVEVEVSGTPVFLWTR